MPNPVRVLFAADGAEAVHQVFRSLKKEAQDLERAMARVTRGRSGGAANTNANATAAKRAADVAVKETERVAQAQAKAASAADRAAQKTAQAEIRAAEKAASEKLRIAQRQSKEVERLAAQEARSTMRWHEQQARRDAKAASAADRAARSSASKATSILGRGARGAIGTVTGIGATLGIAGGGMMIGNGVMNALELQRQAALLSNATSMPGAPGMLPSEIVAMARHTAGATGAKAEDVMAGMNVVSARAGGAPGLKAFKQDLDDVAKTATAAGISMEDMGAVYAAALNSGVQPGEEMRQLMLDLVAQGKAGAVEFSDLASELARLSGAGKAFGGGANMLRAASGLAQVAVETAVSPEESRTAVIDLMREFTQGPKIQMLKQAGVQVNGAGGRIRDPLEMLPEVIQAAETKGLGKQHLKGLAGLSEIFTGKSMEAFAMPLRAVYMNGYQSQVTGKSYTGAEAVRQKLAEARAPTMSIGQREQEFGKVMSTDMQKVAVAMEKFGAEMDKLLPKVAEMVPSLTRLVESLAKAVTWAANNPFASLFALLAASIGAEIAKAQLASVVEKGIAALLRGRGGMGTGGGAPVPGEPAAAPSMLGKAAAVATAAAAGYAVGSEAAPFLFGDTKDAATGIEGSGYKGRKAATEANEAYFGSMNALREVREGRSSMTPEQAKAKANELRAAAAKADEIQNPSVWRQMYTFGGASIAAKAAAGGANKQDLEQQAAAWEAAVKQLTDAAKTAATALGGVKGNGVTDKNSAARNQPASSMASGR